MVEFPGIRYYICDIKSIEVMQRTRKSPNGTSFHNHTFAASVEQLKLIFGKPMDSNNSGKDKINYYWVMETETGEVFTVYDWKTYHPLKDTEVVKWHIGAKKAKISEQAKTEIEAAWSALVKA